jgi:hypothetical protein
MADEIEQAAPDTQGAGKTAAPAKQEIPIGANGKPDPFMAAFNAAEKELAGEDKPKPAPKKEAKPEPKAEKPAPKPEAKPEPKKPEPKAEDAEEEEDGADEAADAKLEAKKTEPLSAKRHWSKRRQDDFQYLPREMQEAWLNEPVSPDGHWPAETKDAFTKMPREAQEEFLVQTRNLERGFGEKFQALSKERKLAEDIRAAVPDSVRQVMQSRGMDEAAVFKTLVAKQQQAMTNPVQYAAEFIRSSKLDINQLAAALQGQPQGNGQAQPQADIESHPVVRTLKAELSELKGHVTSEVQKRQQEEDREIETAFGSFTSERDDGGSLAYPFVRVLSDYMANVIDGDAERFSSMRPRERLVEAYKIALAAHPELASVTRTAKPSPADEPGEDADSEDALAAEKLRRAATKKSNTPTSAPARAGDPFERAFGRAERQLGLSR